ncbi:hypothetical protein V8C35DRAFT_77450 [Trichoderma chlorosporum]
MGNTNTKESRSDYPEDGRGRRFDMGDTSRGVLGDPRIQLMRAERGGFLSLGPSSGSRSRDRPDAPFEHRETKQEREARKLERERVQRAQDRERSIREEHVDGGYLVTMGTYVGTEDFNKIVVRQLQIERKMAPFWRGLNDWSDNWAEHQLIAAARGLPVPAADAPPDPDLIPRLPPPPDSLPTQNLSSLTVEMGPRTLSTASDLSGSGSGSALPSPSTAGPSRGSIKPRARALAAALSGGSRNTSSTDLSPKEINLPHDPFVNGQPLEVHLYKDASECPICFLTYPPYLNHTRCCDQPICSECFVQIKRADPHLPEHHPDGQARDPNEGLSAEDPPEMLISEPSACPYCQQPEFGVTYEPPPFRRGLAFSSPNIALNTAMSSQSSLSSTLAPAPPTAGRRRAHSLSANAPNVITTDRIRPDWATKLASARAHQARRAAAATALHTAAFLIGGNESRSRIRTGRFSRRNTSTNSGGTTTPGGHNGGAADTPEGQEPTERSSSRNPDGTRRTRMEELEEMMFMEAIRLSLAAEEERKRKVEKVLLKEAKKREKEREKAERKALKKQAKDPYAGGISGASGSSLSLGLGRKRGNSAASNLRLELTLQSGSTSASQSTKASDSPHQDTKAEHPGDKGKGIEREPQPGATETTSSASLPIPTSSSRGGSHLRHMSNASSLGSSLGDSPTGSLSGQGPGDSDAAKRLSMGNRSDSGDGETESEPMFNFSSLAEIVGVNLEDGSAVQQPELGEGLSRPLSQVREEEKEEEGNVEHVERTLQIETSGVSSDTVFSATGAESSRDAPPFLDTPELTITPETPIAEDGGPEDKRLGESHVSEHHETTQAMH